MTTHFNNLTPAQTERLAILAEELGEVQQIIGKVLKHGYESCNPDNLDLRTNRQLLLAELTDVEAAITIIGRDIPELYSTPAHDQEVNRAMLKKLRWSHHQDEDFKEFYDAMDRL